MIKHVLGISGGKDSAALAIYMNANFPDIDVEYYTCDTGKELTETYQLIERLNSVLGKRIKEYQSIDLDQTSEQTAFDHFLAVYGGFLPSSSARWCTKKMKLDPFEQEIGDAPTISYVGIRGDEDREGYISNKENIQSIFPFRRNIWSEDVISKALSNSKIEDLKQYLSDVVEVKDPRKGLFSDILSRPISLKYNIKQKVGDLLNVDVVIFNQIVFLFLKTTNYPVGMLDDFPLIRKDSNLGIDDIFQILEDSGVGIPAYYKPLNYEVEIDGELKQGIYSRSRSGCFFCFFQQKIEWVWLLETHPELYEKALEYEKAGYSWSEERLEDLMKPKRVIQIKKDHYLRTQRKSQNQLLDWKDELMEAEGEGCSSCFI